MSGALDGLLRELRGCRACEASLPPGPRPVLPAAAVRGSCSHRRRRARVHASGIPWSDASGLRLRQWMQVDDAPFHDPRQDAIVPMGFCSPDKAGSGDAPPRPECRTTWHPRLFLLLPRVELTLLVGQYAQAYFLGPRRKDSLTATMRAWCSDMPTMLPLPHPNPRNVRWFKDNPRFKGEVLPTLRAQVQEVLAPQA